MNVRTDNIPTHVKCWMCNGSGVVRAEPDHIVAITLTQVLVQFWRSFWSTNKRCPTCEGHRVVPTHAGSGL